MLWLIFLVMILAVLSALLFPLVKGAGLAAPPRADYDMVVYRAQLAEIDDEIERGLLASAQANAARAEVHRRMLAAEDAEFEIAAKPVWAANRYARMAVIAAIAIVVPLGSAIAYGALGSPELPGKPYAWRVKHDPEFIAQTSATELEAELKAKPSAAGYQRLANLYFVSHQYAKAVAADRRAVALGDDSARIWSELGEAVVMQSGGAVAPDALVAFTKALQRDATEARARFYFGLAEAQIGNFKEAVAIWRDLEKGAPAGTPWLGMVREQINRFAKEGGFDPSSVAPHPPSVQAMKSVVSAMTSAVQQHAGAVGAGSTPSRSSAVSKDPAVRAMVAKLAAQMAKNPNDAAGWQRLAHSYTVLGEWAKARDAIDHALRLKPKDVGMLLTLAQIQMAVAPPGDDTAPDFIATMRQVLAIDPSNIQALYFVGLAEQKAGHIAKAKAMWNKVLARAPATDPLVIAIHNRLDVLAGKIKAH